MILYHEDLVFLCLSQPWLRTMCFGVTPLVPCRDLFPLIFALTLISDSFGSLVSLQLSSRKTKYFWISTQGRLTGDFCVHWTLVSSVGVMPLHSVFRENLKIFPWKKVRNVTGNGITPANVMPTFRYWMTSTSPESPVQACMRLHKLQGCTWSWVLIHTGMTHGVKKSAHTHLNSPECVASAGGLCK